jgi:hypothetical protein
MAVQFDGHLGQPGAELVEFGAVGGSDHGGEVGGPRSEVGGRRTEVGGQRSRDLRISRKGTERERRGQVFWGICSVAEWRQMLNIPLRGFAHLRANW